MTSTKAATVILAWLVLVFASMLLAIVSVFFAGVALGSVLTAGALGLTVKWSIEGMLTGTMGNIEEMQEALSNENPTLYDREE